MIAWLKRQWRKVTFYYAWPSWLVELISGLVVAAAVRSLIAVVPLSEALSAQALLLVIYTVGFGLSVLYEVHLDPNGWSEADVAERQVGVFIGAVVFALLA